MSNGFIFYSGPSLLDGRTPIVGIATGIERPTSNIKTGDMIQTWILRRNVHPNVAAQEGKDGAICGSCPLTKLVSRAGRTIRPRRCYVNVSQAPAQIWRSFHRGNYARCGRSAFRPHLSGRKLRIGAYGDPLAIPYTIWRDMLRHVDNWTGYTHSWRERRFWRFRRYIMASCETRADHMEAQSRGWRTFSTQNDIGPDQVLCPNYSHGTLCADCNLCSGASTGAKSIVIPPHGGKAVMSAWAAV